MDASEPRHVLPLVKLRRELRGELKDHLVKSQQPASVEDIEAMHRVLELVEATEEQLAGQGQGQPDLERDRARARR
jgi:hypothetical protein